MKHFKNFLLIFTALVLCAVPFFTTSLTAQAEGDARTFYVKYLPDSDEWKYEFGSWTDNGAHHDIKNLPGSIANGDLLVIDGTNGANINLKVNVYLNNLTVVNGNIANVTATGIDNFYALNNSTSVVNGNVVNAYVYDMCVVNFNNNVTNLNIIHTKRDYVEANINVLGTVGWASANGVNKAVFNYYNFAEGAFKLVDGRLKSDHTSYSTTPVATAPTTPAPAATTATADSEYDDVPKTADNRFNPIWLLGIAVACMSGSYFLKKEY